MIADLHTHTCCSDGSLTPRALIAAARAAGVGMLAITDHDTLDAYVDIEVPDDLQLVSGVELSSGWRRRDIHIVGLNFELKDAALVSGLVAQQSAREERAERIAARLAKLGYPEALAGARAAAGDASLGRPHFADHLVEIGAVRDRAQAFAKYLGNGKAGDVRTDWAGLDEAIGWIVGAGGVAVLAHPAKYRMTRTRLGELVAAFAAAGGGAVEVVSGSQTPNVTAHLAALAQQHGLAASCGSDFHHEGLRWSRLGGAPALPSSCRPVWRGWQTNRPGL